MKSPLRRIFVCKRESAYPPRCGLGFNFEELGLDAGFVLILWEWGLTVDGIYSDITPISKTFQITICGAYKSAKG